MIADLPDCAAIRPARTAEWRPGLVSDETPHNEIFASSGDAAGPALALALAVDRMRGAEPDPLADSPDRRAWLWVQDRTALKQTGRPYRPGLPADLRCRLIHVAAKTPEDALFAIEEGLRCRDLAFVIAEIAGNPRALSFTASRRLSLAAEKHGVPLWLVRVNAERDLSSARMRWQVRSAASAASRWNAQAPGRPGWQAELFRARRHPPGEWVLHEEGRKLAFRKSVHPGKLSDAEPAETSKQQFEGRVARASQSHRLSRRAFGADGVALNRASARTGSGLPGG